MSGQWYAVSPIELHCLECGAIPDEGCRTAEGRSVPPHTARIAAWRDNQHPKEGQ